MLHIYSPVHVPIKIRDRSFLPAKSGFRFAQQGVTAKKCDAESYRHWLQQQMPHIPKARAIKYT